jgi:hypothetical protein
MRRRRHPRPLVVAALSVDERDLACTICGCIIHVVGGEWIDPDLYQCQPCRRGEHPLQASFLPVREEWHAGNYDPRMARIPY